MDWNSTSRMPGADKRTSVGRIGAEMKRSLGVDRRALTDRILELLEQLQLSPTRRRGETAAVEPRRPPSGAVAVQPEAPAGDVEALLDQLGEVAGAGHAGAEARIVVLAAAQLVDDADHVLGALRIGLGEPLLEQRLQLVRQSHDHVR